MKAFIFLVTILISSTFISCGSDGCDASDWVGTYDKVSEDCPDGTVAFVDQIIMAAAPTNGAVSVDGNLINVDETTCSVVLAGDTAVLEGGRLTITSGDCSAVYE